MDLKTLPVEELEGKLQAGLENLTGLDFEQIERIERQNKNVTPLLNWSSAFQAQLAARALGVNVNEIKALPLNRYNFITSTVSNFLFTLDSETAN